jgi:hypothetical protein
MLHHAREVGRERTHLTLEREPLFCRQRAVGLRERALQLIEEPPFAAGQRAECRRAVDFQRQAQLLRVLAHGPDDLADFGDQAFDHPRAGVDRR